MQLAQQEAQRLNHEFVGTEHILLGMIKEGSGVAAYVLKNLDIDMARARIEVEKLVKAGPDVVTMGKLPQTPRAKKVIEYAIEQARLWNHNYVGTEHLLAGLVKEPEGIACQVLNNLGASIQSVEEEVKCLLGFGQEKKKDADTKSETEEDIRALLFGGTVCGVTSPFKEESLGSPGVRCNISRKLYDELCEKYGTDAQKKEKAEREKPTIQRTLVDGRKVPESEVPVPQTVDSKCPDKWLFVDLECCQIWRYGKTIYSDGMGPWANGMSEVDLAALKKTIERIEAGKKEDKQP